MNKDCIVLPVVSLESSWIEILGSKPGDIPGHIRKERWEEWKRIALSKGKQSLVDYWSKNHVEETCSKCKYRKDDWCKLQDLPCNVNPVLTMKDNTIGMACMGEGFETT